MKQNNSSIDTRDSLSLEMENSGQIFQCLFWWKKNVAKLDKFWTLKAAHIYHVWMMQREKADKPEDSKAAFQSNFLNDCGTLLEAYSDSYINPTDYNIWVFRLSYAIMMYHYLSETVYSE